MGEMDILWLFGFECRSCDSGELEALPLQQAARDAHDASKSKCLGVPEASGTKYPF